MRKIKYRRILLLMWLITPLLSASAQTDSQDSAEAKKVCVFPSVDLTEAETTRDYRNIIAGIIESELENAGFTIIPRDEWTRVRRELALTYEELYTPANAIAVARRLEADIAVTGFYRIDGQRLLMGLKCYDIKQGRILTGAIRTSRVGLGAYDLIRESIDEVMPELKAPSEVLPPMEISKDEKLTSVTLLSKDEGAAVYIASEEPIGKITNGSLEVLSIKGTDLDIEVRKKGFHPRRVVLSLDEEKRDIELDKLMQETWWASEILYTLGQFGGFGFALRFYPLPDMLFLSVEEYFFVSDVLRTDRDPSFNSDMRLLVGLYLFTGPNAVVRLGVSSGIGILSSNFASHDDRMYTDPYFNVANLWLELSLYDWAFFVRGELKYGLGGGKDHHWAGRWQTYYGSVPPITLGVVKKWR